MSPSARVWPVIGPMAEQLWAVIVPSSPIYILVQARRRKIWIGFRSGLEVVLFCPGRSLVLQVHALRIIKIANQLVV